MAFDAFIQIDGIPGESTDAAHKDWVEILSFRHLIEQPASATASSVGGATAERVNHAPFEITHLIDKASPKLYEAACTGKHIKTVTIDLCRAGGDKVKYMQIVLEQVIVSRIEPKGASSTAEDGFPLETVHFSYGTIKWTYTQQQRADGVGGGNIATGWDLTTNKVIA
ncbi:MAG: type VI secretion system tube protein Hcp [Azoarcus sp.]|jgi:type VI secretion system secreted protein Hcp|nr:type VI secretion system tube protein Hcp [Azoarcus sp.]